jgi:hypothetical protein
MKILGSINSGYSPKYIAEISHDEISKVFNYRNESLKDNPLSVGSIIDLKSGYNYTNDIEKLCNEMIATMKKFDDAKQTLTNFAMMIIEKSEEKKNQ